MKKLAITAVFLTVLAVGAGCQPGYPEVPKSSVAVANTREVVIYVPAEDNIIDMRRAKVNKTDNQYLDALGALLKSEFLPKGTKVLDAKVNDKGAAVVNLSRQVLNRKAKTQTEEALGIAAIVRTMGEFKEVKKVSLRVEGKTEGKIGGKDIRNWWGFGGFEQQPFSVDSE